MECGAKAENEKENKEQPSPVFFSAHIWNRLEQVKQFQLQYSGMKGFFCGPLMNTQDKRPKIVGLSK